MISSSAISGLLRPAMRRVSTHCSWAESGSSSGVSALAGWGGEGGGRACGMAWAWAGTFFWVRAGKRVKRVFCCLESAITKLRACLPDEHIGDELARMFGRLQAHEERGESSLGLGLFPAHAQDQESQEF